MHMLLKHQLLAQLLLYIYIFSYIANSVSINFIVFGKRPFRRPASNKKPEKLRSLGGFIKNEENARFGRLRSSRKLETAEYSSEMVRFYNKK